MSCPSWPEHLCSWPFRGRFSWGTRGIIRLTTCCCKGSSVLFFWPISLPGCGWLTTVGVFFFRNLYFFLLSVPYLNIVDWMGIELSHAEAMLMGLVPLLRALLGLYVLFTWIINNRVTRLLTSYVLSMLVFTYFAALIFYDYEIEVNPALHDFGDAIWWASMNLTTVGADIFAVTAVGKILTVLLPTLGMMMFPIFTVYVTQIYTRNRKSDS